MQADQFKNKVMTLFKIHVKKDKIQRQKYLFGKQPRQTERIKKEPTYR